MFQDWTKDMSTQHLPGCDHPDSDQGDGKTTRAERTPERLPKVDADKLGKVRVAARRERGVVKQNYDLAATTRTPVLSIL